MEAEDISMGYENLAQGHFVLACRYRTLLKMLERPEGISQKQIADLIDLHERKSESYNKLADKYQNMLH